KDAATSASSRVTGRPPKSAWATPMVRSCPAAAPHLRRINQSRLMSPRSALGGGSAVSTDPWLMAACTLPLPLPEHVLGGLAARVVAGVAGARRGHLPPPPERPLHPPPLAAPDREERRVAVRLLRGIGREARAPVPWSAVGAVAAPIADLGEDERLAVHLLKVRERRH